ncbi:MAG: phosphopantothenoylcysteine decarboxylase domain-containing protein [Planctomycetota bacterium]|jgi:phosphopantothenoylcysteine decarboxylase/phosphopantothenate--cysteine ligase
MHFLITAGGTREYIDPVRFISNASSGQMGYALAGAAQKAGHKVTLISASDLQPPVGVEFVGVESAAEMFKAVKHFFGKCDCLIMAAAVSDYTPVRLARTKIRRSKKSLTLKLKPTTDILEWAVKQKRVKSKKGKGKSQIIVGFALEDKDLRKRAEKKLKEKNLDIIVANTVAAIGAENSAVQMKTPTTRWTKVGTASKHSVARRIIAEVERSVAGGSAR